MEQKIENFSCSTDGTFKFRVNKTFYNCEFAKDRNIKVEYNSEKGVISKEIECTPVDYDNYYDFCLEMAEQIIKKLEIQILSKVQNMPDNLS